MTNDIGSLVGDLTAHRNLSAQRAGKQASPEVTSLEAELDLLVLQVIDEDIEEKLIERLIDEATRPSDLPDEDYDGDTMDPFGDERQDAIYGLIGIVGEGSSLVIEGLVISLAWELLDRTQEGEFLTIFKNVGTQVEEAKEAEARIRLARSQW